MKTITDKFEEHLGAKQWDTFVRDMVHWYYGRFAEVAWCAISASYMMNELGLLSQIGGKEQNTYRMMTNAEKACKNTGKGVFHYAKDLKKGTTIKKGTIIFMLRSDPPMTVGSKKHVTTAYTDFVYKGSGTFPALGGNQSGAIMVKNYNQSTIYGMFYPDYSEDKPNTHPTLQRGDKGKDVKTMQTVLRKIGFANITGEEMVADGSYGKITTATVIAFQVICGLKADGICGSKTWKKMDELLLMPKCSTVAQTNVNVRIGPGTGFNPIDTVKEGTKVYYTTIIDGWLYLPTQKGWSRSKWYNL